MSEAPVRISKTVERKVLNDDVVLLVWQYDGNAWGWEPDPSRDYNPDFNLSRRCHCKCGTMNFQSDSVCRDCNRSLWKTEKRLLHLRSGVRLWPEDSPFTYFRCPCPIADFQIWTGRDASECRECHRPFWEELPVQENSTMRGTDNTSLGRKLTKLSLLSQERQMWMEMGLYISPELPDHTEDCVLMTSSGAEEKISATIANELRAMVITKWEYDQAMKNQGGLFPNGESSASAVDTKAQAIKDLDEVEESLIARGTSS